MNPHFFFLWLNDTTPDRHYWNATTQRWSTNFAQVTKFDTREAAQAEAERAQQTTTAEVILQPMMRNPA